MTPSRVELHIQELVVHGVGPLDARRIGAAVERELARLLAERGVPPQWLEGAGREAVDGQTFVAAAGEPAPAVGAAAARAVYGGLA